MMPGNESRFIADEERHRHHHVSGVPSCLKQCLVDHMLQIKLLLLIDGAWEAARMFGPANPARGNLTLAARSLIDAQPISAVTRGRTGNR
jgi:hypothetical protein